MRSVLEQAGIAVEPIRVARIADRVALTGSGTAVPFDLFVNATGLAPNRLAHGINLPLDDRGALRLDRHLRSVADPVVHGGGDAVAVEDHELPASASMRSVRRRFSSTTSPPRWTAASPRSSAPRSAISGS